MNVLTSLTMVIIPQYTCISNHHSKKCKLRKYYILIAFFNKAGWKRQKIIKQNEEAPCICCSRSKMKKILLKEGGVSS